MKPLLSILILTVPDRREYLARLMDALHPQLSSSIVVPEPDGEEDVAIGRKRQRMLDAVRTPYVCFFDDDDLPSDDYCSAMIEAIEQGADVVGFRMRCYNDGAYTGEAIHSLECQRWNHRKLDDGSYLYTRTPNHLNPIRTEIAQEIGYKPWMSREDADYSRRLYERFGETMKEVFVDKYVYDYFYRTKPKPLAEERYDRKGRLTRRGMELVIGEGGSVMVNGVCCWKVEQLDSLGI